LFLNGSYFEHVFLWELNCLFFTRNDKLLFLNGSYFEHVFLWD